MFLGRIARDLRETISKQYDELHSKISETEVEKWTRMADAEREHLLFPITSDLTDCKKVQRAIREDASAHDQMARDTYQKLMDILIGLNKPIIHISDQLSTIQDKLNSSFSFTLHFIASNTDLYKETSE